MNPPDRLHSLDALRAFALILGIVLHATISFLPGDSDTKWFFFPDVSSSATLDVTAYAIHTFRMTLFFLIAGFFARLSFHRKGWRGFMLDRGKRIVLPLVVGLLLLLPLIFAAFPWGASMHGPRGSGVPLEAPQRGLPWVHLWFLYLLVVLYVLALSVRGLFVVVADRNGALRRYIDGGFHFIVSYRIAPIIFAMPLGISLYVTDWWFMKRGIPTPEAGFVPNTPALIGYGVAFSTGWLLQRQANLLDVLREHCFGYLASGLALTIAARVLIDPLPTFAVVPTSSLFRAAYIACYATAGWCWTLGLTGAAVRYCSNHNATRRFLADASYWMYLIHLPLVFALQIWVKNWPIHWSVKFSLILVLCFTVLLVSYRYLVRYTFIGALLNDRKQIPAFVAH